MKISRFEDLECWQKARLLSKQVYRLVNQSKFAKDFRLAGQITGAIISIMNNISEGFDSRSHREFIRFLLYSRRSCSEVQNCLYIALDQSYISEKDFHSNYSRCEKVRKMIDGLTRYLKTCPASAPVQPTTDNSTHRQTGKPANRQT
jgi:four helix bundle protein